MGVRAAVGRIALLAPRAAGPDRGPARPPLRGDRCAGPAACSGRVPPRDHRGGRLDAAPACRLSYSSMIPTCIGPPTASSSSPSWRPRPRARLPRRPRNGAARRLVAHPAALGRPRRGPARYPSPSTATTTMAASSAGSRPRAAAALAAQALRRVDPFDATGSPSIGSWSRPTRPALRRPSRPPPLRLRGDHDDQPLPLAGVEPHDWLAPPHAAGALVGWRPPDLVAGVPILLRHPIGAARPPSCACAPTSTSR